MKRIRLSYCIIAYIFIAYLNSFIASNISLPKGVFSKLFDIGHYYLPEISTLYPDLMFFSIFIYFVLRWKNDSNILKVFFIICSSLFLLRIITFPTTHLTPAFNGSDCFKPMIDGPWIFFTFYSQSTCIDYMFSAHTFHLTIISLLTISNSTYYFEQLLIPSISIINIIIIVAARMHYTVDIIIGFILSILIYSIYELYRQNRILNNKIKLTED